MGEGLCDDSRVRRECEFSATNMNNKKVAYAMELRFMVCLKPMYFKHCYFLYMANSHSVVLFPIPSNLGGGFHRAALMRLFG